jgi:glycosyltransferase involved in cell wall biosynthesis
LPKIININVNKIRVIFFINTYSDYLNDFIKSISLIFEVRVILTSLNNKNTSYTKFIDKKIYYSLCDHNLKSELKKYNPNFVIIGGYKHKKIKLLIDFCKKNKTKYLFWLERINKNFYLKLFLFKILYGNRIRNSNGVLAIGNEAYKFYKQFQKNTFKLPYSIDVKKFKKPKLQKKTNFIFVGQFIERKGIQSILDSFDHLNKNIKDNIKFTFIGRGPLKKKILNKSKEYNFIRLRKFMNVKNLINILSNNKILLFPSNYDGWGVAPMEAMSAKMALIISKNCGINEYLSKSDNAIFTDVEPKNIAKAMSYYFFNKNKIYLHGKNNLKLIKKSLLNSINSSKKFTKIIKKLNSDKK